MYVVARKLCKALPGCCLAKHANPFSLPCKYIHKYIHTILNLLTQKWYVFGFLGLSQLLLYLGLKHAVGRQLQDARSPPRSLAHHMMMMDPPKWCNERGRRGRHAPRERNGHALARPLACRARMREQWLGKKPAKKKKKMRRVRVVRQLGAETDARSELSSVCLASLPTLMSKKTQHVSMKLTS